MEDTNKDYFAKRQDSYFYLLTLFEVKPLRFNHFKASMISYSFLFPNFYKLVYIFKNPLSTLRMKNLVVIFEVFKNSIIGQSACCFIA